MSKLVVSTLCGVAVCNPAFAEAMPGAIDPTQAVAATLTRQFATERIDAETCQDTTFGAEVSTFPTTSAFAANATMITDSDTRDLSLLALNPQDWVQQDARFTGFDAFGFHLLTRAAGGATRYTIHLNEGPMAITYLGRCEEVQ